jgi:deoxyuridine 5'-triphosphate nucleotidohydrolase
MTASPVMIPFVRLPNGEGVSPPFRATAGAAGYDLHAAEDATIQPGEFLAVATGYALAIPDGYEGQVRPRSGLAAKHGVTVLNAPGTVDSDYRGEVKVILINLGQDAFVIKRGERIAQMVIAPVTRAELNVVATLDETLRGSGGFGSTGR